MFSRGPSFQMIPIDLSVAGYKDWNENCSVVIFVRAEDSNRALALDARVGVQLGDVASAVVPAGINALFKLKQTVPLVRFSWEAQPGITAYFLVAADDQLMVHAPPARQLVTSAVGNNISTAAINVASAAPVQLAAADGARQSVVIQNVGAADMYIGGSSVTAATGLRIAANGGSYVVDKCTAAVWAITQAGAAEARVMVEA
ncbi:MAG: hypothetical protein ACM3Q1_05900 [Bacteroidales bacterium]